MNNIYWIIATTVIILIIYGLYAYADHKRDYSDGSEEMLGVEFGVSPREDGL